MIVYIRYMRGQPHGGRRRVLEQTYNTMCMYIYIYMHTMYIYIYIYTHMYI